MFAGIGYSVESNKEHGLGRPDIRLKDRDRRRAMIIESKHSKQRADMDKDCDKALAQIKEMEYDKDIPDGYEQIVCCGVSFFKKRCLVKFRVETIED
jgi:hypothetical protein